MPDTERLMAKTADEGRINPENPQVIGVTRKGDNNQPTIPDVLPILPVRSLVIFPIPALPDGTPWRLPDRTKTYHRRIRPVQTLVFRPIFTSPPERSWMASAPRTVHPRIVAALTPFSSRIARLPSSRNSQPFTMR